MAEVSRQLVCPCQSQNEIASYHPKINLQLQIYMDKIIKQGTARSAMIPLGKGVDSINESVLTHLLGSQIYIHNLQDKYKDYAENKWPTS